LVSSTRYHNGNLFEQMDVRTGKENVVSQQNIQDTVYRMCRGKYFSSSGAHSSRSFARGFSRNHAPGRRLFIAFRQHSTWLIDVFKSISLTSLLQFEKYLFSKDATLRL
jgi:hypothetical protein